MLFLPGLHGSGNVRQQRGRSLSNESSLYSYPLTSSTASVGRSSINSGWSPFHIRMRVTTRLLFNDAGRVVHHRDLIDLRDLIRGFPGGTLFQWLTSTVAAQSLSLFSRLLIGHRSRKEDSESSDSHPTGSRYSIQNISPLSRPDRASDVDLNLG